jgi:glycosyltransferase involved in cell wall biosynthesis
MATYNGSQYVKQQLESILIQLSDNDEVIISDDSSQDNTVEVIESLCDKRINLFYNQKFHSPIFNLENTLKYAKGDYIFLSDQDDVWFLDKVRRTIDFLNVYDCVVSDAIIVDTNMAILSNSLFIFNHSKKGFIHNLLKNGYAGCCMAFKRKILNYILPFPNDIPMHDIWIGLIAELFGKTYFYRKPLIYYRRHDNNASQTSKKSKHSLIKRLLYRYTLVKNVVIRIKTIVCTYSVSFYD